MKRGEILNLADIGKLAKSASEEGDIDKMIALLDKAGNLLNNPIVKGLLGGNKPQAVNERQLPTVPIQTMEAVATVPETPQGIAPRSELHDKLFTLLNGLDEAELLSAMSELGINEETAKGYLDREDKD